MTTFGAFALILTSTYVVYYAINIAWDLYKARETEPKEEEIIDVSDMIEKEPMPIGAEIVQQKEEVINSQEETPSTRKSQEPPQNNETFLENKEKLVENNEKLVENNENTPDAASELDPVARHINEEMASEPAEPRHWEDYTDEEVALLVVNNPQVLSSYYRTAEDVEKRDTNLL